MRCGNIVALFLSEKVDTALMNDSHAYQMVNCPEHGRDGFRQPNSPSKGHGKSFGTMMRAVYARALDVMGLKGDSEPYAFYDFSRGEGYH